MSKKVVYSVAMSKDTGAIVMVRTRGKQVEVVGSISREDSLDFVKGIMQWAESTIANESRVIYPH